MMIVRTANSTYVIDGNNCRLTCVTGTFAGHVEEGFYAESVKVGEPMTGTDGWGNLVLRTTPVVSVEGTVTAPAFRRGLDFDPNAAWWVTA